jgi:hypothetical protein
MDYGLADCAPPVHAIEHPEPPSNPLFGTIKICIDYDSSLLLQRAYSQILSEVEECTWRSWQATDRFREPAYMGKFAYKRGESRTTKMMR